MQRGRIVICGDVGANLGDSLYDGTIFVGGKIKSLGADAVETEMTELDISTISRVTRGKYVQTPWGVFELKHFFSDGIMNQSGEEVSTNLIKSSRF